jgi:hypothetical protein
LRSRLSFLVGDILDVAGDIELGAAGAKPLDVHRVNAEPVDPHAEYDVYLKKKAGL